jgi:glycosyltransferase involved in cell wall biosynthesis
MRLLVYGDIGGSGGYVRYCRGLFGSQAIPTSVEVYFVGSPQFCQKVFPLDDAVHIVAHGWLASTSRLKRYIWHLWLYPRLVKRIRPDVEFYPSGNLRTYGRNPKSVATCHNLLLFDPPEMQRYQAGDAAGYRSLAYSRKQQSRSFQSASGVIFLSEYSRQGVLNELPGIRCHTVIAHGLDSEFRLPEPRSYEFGERVNLLYVSTILYYKHQAEVVRAVGLVRRDTGLDLRLRLVGSAASPALMELREVIRAEQAEQYVTIVGEQSREDLLCEYHTANIFLFASSCETFGITLLEAMGARLPIACSELTGLPDILKDAGVYFDPKDHHSIAAALEQLLHGTVDQRQALGIRAYEYSKAFTWLDCSRQTLEFIQSI